jgi:hypothetical protein
VEADENAGVIGAVIRTRALLEGVQLGERKIAVIAGWAQRDSIVPSLNVEGMTEECGAVVKLEAFMGRDLKCVRINAGMLQS